MCRRQSREVARPQQACTGPASCTKEHEQGTNRHEGASSIAGNACHVTYAHATKIAGSNSAAVHRQTNRASAY